MHKYMKRTAAALLAGVFIIGQACTALAAQDDSNYGPAFGTTKAEQTAPGGGQASGDNQASGGNQASSDNQASGGNQTQPTQGAATETIPGNDAAANAQADADAAAAQAAAEQAAAAEEAAMQAAIIANTPYLQRQVLRPDTTWTDPVIGDTTVVSEGGFRSLCIYLNNIVGNVLYRTYTSAHGWSEWAMNGDHTTVWEDGALVEAIQIRFTGFVGNTFDVYYQTTLTDGTELNWARNGQTAGTMGTGKVMQSFRVSLWGKNGEAASYNMDKPLEAAAPDGIQTIDGAVVYSNGTGVPFTGWGWNDRDRYYFVNNVPVTGWQYIDGYKYYFDETGKVVTDLEPIIGANGPFLIRINKQMNTTTVYVKDGGNGFIIPLKTFLCSTGEDTPLGTFKTPEKYRWRLMNSGVYTQYATRLGSGLSFLLHSIIYDSPNVNTLKPETYNFLGVVRSAGCIRYTSGDSKWIFDHCALGTTVEVYNSSIPGPYDRPAIEQPISADQHWDPTDPVAVAAMNGGQ